MSNTARKARKRAGEKFVRTEKVGTPIQFRQPSSWNQRRRLDRQYNVIMAHKDD